jgi:hypothetical protein
MTEEPKDAPLLPRCPHCRKDVVGLQVLSMTLPNPARNVSHVWNLVCCPNPDCRCVLPALYCGDVPLNPSDTAGKVWTPADN